MVPFLKHPRTLKDHIDKKSVLDLLVLLYLNLLTFQRQYDIPLIKIHQTNNKTRYKCYDVMIDKKKTIKDLKIIKDKQNLKQ